MLRKAPPLPFLPASVHGTEVVILAVVYAGDVEAGERAAAPVLRFGEPVGSALGPTPYAGFQTAFDPLLTPGGRNYWKSNNFSTLSDAALDVVIDAAGRLPGPECEIFVAQLGGAMARVNPSATAFVGRDARYIMNVHGRWSDPRDDERVRDWARQAFSDAAPHATGSGYVNFLTEDEGERVAASYGSNYPRLQAVKRRFDPGNLFRMNLNIAPAARRASSAVRHRALPTAMSSPRLPRLRGLRRDAGGAAGVRARARRVPGLAQRRRGARSRSRCRRRRLRDGARAAGLPAPVQPRPARVAAARPVLARAAALPANARERLHLAAIAAVLADDYERAKALLGELLREHPRDALALQAAHALDYVTGDVARMGERVAARPAGVVERPARLPRRAGHARLRPRGVRRLRAGGASRAAALALDPLDARAHHVMAHVFEMTERADAGVRWLDEHVAGWAERHRRRDALLVALALFQLAHGQIERALALYDAHVRAGCSAASPT